MLYGSTPLENKQHAASLKPVMHLRARILAVNHVAAGARVGYGGDWTATRDSRIAILGIGYGDGYPRRIDAAAQVLINGQHCPLAGRVSMDMLAVDVSALSQVATGDIATLWGEGLPVDQVAEQAGTISYELLSRVQSRVPRYPLAGD